ncbi:MAG: acetyl-CoA acetyltransferase, partial [Proteobacteria bacterium]|nr:acetyl-CoA acetyltransferase [Pseudomonadota bacterium]
NEHEYRYNIQSAIQTYALFENAWRANRGLSLAEHRQRMGSLMSRLSETAAANPYARFPRHLTLEEITRVRADNRMVCFPYTKRMIANLDVNKSSTLLMTTVSRAQAMGIPRDRWIYWWGGGDADENPWFVSERPDFHSCPAMKISASRALTEAGISIDEVDMFDLYSCFHIAIQLAREEMGLAETDSRPFSVTGGLPYAGQAGSNCGMESVAMMAQRLRKAPGRKGMVTGNGWYLTKQSTGIYCSEPKERHPKRPAPSDGIPTRKPVELVPEGQEVSGTVETYTIEHSRDGKPQRGLIIGRTDDGRRFLSHTPTNREFLQNLMEDEIIGLPGKSVFNGETQIFELT